MEIRLINENEYGEVSKMIARSLENSAFAVFYPQCSVEYMKEILNAEGVEQRAKNSHFYVLLEEGSIVGCGAIAPYDGSCDESQLCNIFVDAGKQGKGFGKKIIETLEKDEYFLRAKRIEISASVSAIPFYRKLGYEHKNHDLIYNDGQFLLEKFNNWLIIFEMYYNVNI